MDECSFSPQVLSGTFPTTQPTLTPRDTVLFEYGVSSVELRNPELNDGETIGASRIQRETTGNRLIIYRDDIWPKTEVKTISFRGLNVTDVANLRAFISLTLGKVVTYTDYLSRVYNVIITNPDTTFTEENADCNYTVKLDLQGSEAS